MNFRVQVKRANERLETAIIDRPAKSVLRARLRRKRQAVSQTERARLALQAQAKLLPLTIWQKAQHIGFYWPMPEEFDCKPLINSALAHDKNCYLPKIADNSLLCFVAYEQGALLSKQNLGFWAPIQDHNLSPQALDLLIMPLVAFDHSGQRLGLGGGFYDRSLKLFTRASRPFLLGLAYDFQGLDDLPHDPWDVPLDAILTPESFIYARGESSSALNSDN